MACRAELDGLPFSTLSLEEANSLELPFREDEVFTALNEMDGTRPQALMDFPLLSGKILGILSKANHGDV